MIIKKLISHCLPLCIYNHIYSLSFKTEYYHARLLVLRETSPFICSLISLHVLYYHVNCDKTAGLILEKVKGKGVPVPECISTLSWKSMVQWNHDLGTRWGVSSTWWMLYPSPEESLVSNG
jgi:hypothetical protein